MNKLAWLVCLIWMLAGVTAHATPKYDVDVVIVGAGLSGLSTAHALKRLGITYRVLELSPKVGGRVRTVSYAFPGEEPTSADSGMEEYWESNPAISLIKELKLPLSHDVAISSIVLEGTLYKLGDESQDEYYSRIFSPQEKAALEAFKTEVAPMSKTLMERQRAFVPAPEEWLSLKDTSFADWVKAKNLPSKVSEWIRVSIECEIASSWDRISALDGIAEFHIFLGKGEESFRVKGGNANFVEALARSVGEQNILVNQRVTRIETLEPVVKVSYLDQVSSTQRTLMARAVVTTVPLFRSAFEIQFSPPLSEQKRAAMMSQTWGSYFKAHVFFPKHSSRFWTNTGTSFLPILSDTKLGVIYDGNRESKSQTHVISLLTIGSDAERFNLMPLDVVRAELTAAFEKFWPGSSKEIKGMEFYRFHPRAIAGWPVGRSRFDHLSQEMRKSENRVYFAGDFTETTHSDGAVIAAQRVTRQILQEVFRNDPTRTNGLAVAPSGSGRSRLVRARTGASKKIHR